MGVESICKELSSTSVRGTSDMNYNGASYDGPSHQRTTSIYRTLAMALFEITTMLTVVILNLPPEDSL